MADEHVPDVYADGVSVSAGPMGLTITLLRSDPPIFGTSVQQPMAVGRVRMSLELGDALVGFVRESIKNARELPIETFGMPVAAKEDEPQA
jgi:hypothetical protein